MVRPAKEVAILVQSRLFTPLRATQAWVYKGGLQHSGSVDIAMPPPTILRYPYHLPAHYNAQAPLDLQKLPDASVVGYVGEIYDEQGPHAAAFRGPNEPVLTTTPHPDHPHLDAPNQVPVADIFDEVFVCL